MVFKHETMVNLKRKMNQLSIFKPTFLALRIQTVYKNAEGKCFLAKQENNSEVRIFPNFSIVYFKKGGLWELLDTPFPMKRANYDKLICGYELKFTDEDEFSHWTNLELSTPRKRKEWKNFNLIKSGNINIEEFELVTPSYIGLHGTHL